MLKECSSKVVKDALEQHKDKVDAEDDRAHVKEIIDADLLHSYMMLYNKDAKTIDMYSWLLQPEDSMDQYVGLDGVFAFLQSQPASNTRYEERCAVIYEDLHRHVLDTINSRFKLGSLKLSVRMQQ